MTQIKGAEVARDLYTALIYPSDKYYKWFICRNHINNCPLTVHDVEVAQKVWGKNIAALKRNTTWRNPNVVAKDQVKIPVRFIKFYKEVFLKCNIFFMNEIPFFVRLSLNIYFASVNHLANFIMPEIFKSFEELYHYYLHSDFRITTVHADVKSVPLKSLMEYLPGVPLVNLAAEN